MIRVMMTMSLTDNVGEEIRMMIKIIMIITLVRRSTIVIKIAV